MTMTEIQQLDVEVLHQNLVEKTSVDIQVATAKRYPRNVARVRDSVVALVTMDKDTAQSCSYALPRGDKPITGPSVHLARILAQQYGNIRAEAKVVEITDKQVVSRGTAWDLENNYAVAYEVRRSIVGKYGRYSDDMITVTGNAANAIAYRNAVLSIIPKGITESALKEAQKLITGDLADDKALAERRKKAINYFNSSFGITEKEVLQLLGKQKVDQIKAKDIATLLGIQQSLVDGDTTVDDLMSPIRGVKEKIETKKKIMKNKKTIDLP